MNEIVKLKIGLDYHGVITDNIYYFKYFSASLKQRGHQLHIITGGPFSIVEKQLKKDGIIYSDIFTIYDYYKSKNQVTYLADGSFKIEDELWNKAKAEYCQRKGIHIHIDDSIVYRQYFLTPYCLYDKTTKSCSCTPQKQKLDLYTLPPTQTIMQLERMFS